MLQRWRREGRDAIECLVLPGLAAVLPWRWCYALFRRLAGWRWLYREACAASVAGARARGWLDEAGVADWERACRLVCLVDHADFFLALTRRDAWMNRHLTVCGQWPAASGPALLCTFHWGAGMWGLRHAGASGLAPHALGAPLRAETCPGRSVLYHYYGWRNRAVRNAVRSAPIDASAGLREVLKALRRGEQVMAAVDVPADQAAASTRISFLGQPARVPRALFRLAAEQGFPVTVYLTGFDLHSGRRTLDIVPVATDGTADALTRAVFAHLETAVRRSPPAWHFWAVAERFFDDSPPAPAGGA